MVYVCSRCTYCREDGQFMITSGLFEPRFALSPEGTMMGGGVLLHQKVEVFGHTHTHTHIRRESDQSGLVLGVCRWARELDKKGRSAIRRAEKWS